MAKGKLPSNPVRIVIAVPASVEELDSDASLALRAAVRAVLPGRQQAKNLEASLITGRAAFYRTMLRLRRAREKVRDQTVAP